MSLAPHAWLVRRLAGPDFPVATMLPPGGSPATYQPADAHLSEVLGARLYVRAGVPFERGGWFETLRRAGPRLRIVDSRRDLTLRPIEGHGDGEPDPHAWLAPALLASQARTIRDVLAAVFPERAEVFARNFAELETELEGLDRELRATLAPWRGRPVFVYHPAWGYFLDAYGLEQVPVEAAGHEPSDAELTRFLVRARAAGARVLFVQPQFAGPSAAALADALGLRLETLDALAYDVAANLRRAARRIAGSYAR